MRLLGWWSEKEFHSFAPIGFSKDVLEDLQLTAQWFFFGWKPSVLKDWVTWLENFWTATLIRGGWKAKFLMLHQDLVVWDAQLEAFSSHWLNEVFCSLSQLWSECRRWHNTIHWLSQWPTGLNFWGLLIFNRKNKPSKLLFHGAKWLNSRYTTLLDRNKFKMTGNSAKEPMIHGLVAWFDPGSHGGKTLGFLGPLNDQAHIHLISRVYLWGISWVVPPPRIPVANEGL